MRFWLMMMSAASDSLFSWSLLTIGKYLSASSLRPGNHHQLRVILINLVNQVVASMTSASRFA
jgi:hypothetical protein